MGCRHKKSQKSQESQDLHGWSDPATRCAAGVHRTPSWRACRHSNACVQLSVVASEASEPQLLRTGLGLGSGLGLGLGLGFGWRRRGWG